MSMDDQLKLLVARIGTEIKKVRPAPFMAPSGWLQPPAGMSGAAGAAVTSGKLTLVPFDVGRTQRYAAHVVGVTVQQVTGSGVTYVRTGVYGSRTDGFPDLTNLLASSTDMVLFSGSNKSGTIDVTLSPGRYWNAFLWVATVAPTTVPQVFGINPGLILPHAAATQVGTAVRGYSATGQTALPTTQITLSPEGGNTAVAVYAQAA